MHERTTLIIGEVFVDTHLDIITENGPLVRLGGIFHSARAFSAMEQNYALAYFSPGYLDDDINEWSCVLGTKGCFRLGNINRAPNIMLIQESKEAGDQGYYNILKDQAEYAVVENVANIMDAVKPTDILIFPGRYDNKRIMKDLEDFEGRLHIDFHYDSNEILEGVNREVETIILSTSSPLFKEMCHGCFKGIREYFCNHSINQFLVKENRGGSYCYVCNEDKTYEAESYYVPTMHSVGVGDVYNAIFVSSLFDGDIGKRMRLAAICAAKYAETMSFDKFKENALLMSENIDELSDLRGIRLSWEDRSKKNIYMAAPDFPDIDTKMLDTLCSCLMYHNFLPRLPIRENGLASQEIKYEDELRIYQKDLQLLKSCDLLIAVLLFNDPGTLVELGMFKQNGKPTIIFDPFHYCNNMFVRLTPDYFCHTIVEVINATYQCLGRG